MHSLYYTVYVSARTVFFALIAVFDIYTEFFQRFFVFFFIVVGERFAFAVRIGYHRIRHTEIFIEFGIYRRDVFGNFAKTIEIVPRKHKSCLFAPRPQRFDDEKGRGYVPEIAYVYRARRTGARRAQKFFFTRILRYKFVRYSLCPMHTVFLSIIF